MENEKVPGHPTEDFLAFMHVIKEDLNKVEVLFEIAARFCGDRDDVCICRHLGNKSFLKPCSVLNCPFLRN
jgi:hypothetical protein